jgi:hypothetical protein
VRDSISGKFKPRGAARFRSAKALPEPNNCNFKLFHLIFVGQRASLDKCSCFVQRSPVARNPSERLFRRSGAN